MTLRVGEARSGRRTCADRSGNTVGPVSKPSRFPERGSGCLGPQRSHRGRSCGRRIGELVSIHDVQASDTIQIPSLGHRLRFPGCPASRRAPDAARSGASATDAPTETTRRRRGASRCRPAAPPSGAVSPRRVAWVGTSVEATREGRVVWLWPRPGSPKGPGSRPSTHAPRSRNTQPITHSQRKPFVRLRSPEGSGVRAPGVRL